MSPGPALRFVPALVLGFGVLATMGLDRQRPLPLEAPLDAVVPAHLEGYGGRDFVLPDDQVRAAGIDAYLLRSYSAPADTTGFSLYVGYYEQQTRGRTIHTPKNCLPGGGWEAIASQEEEIGTRLGTATVNRYVVQKGAEQALVYYWYQGRGRVTANEYRVKWNLLRDAALRQRSEEALVRIVLPISPGASIETQSAAGRRLAAELIPAIDRALPN